MGAKTILSLEEFERLEDDGMLHELDEGELITMPPTNRTHGRVQRTIVLLLAEYLKRKPIGELYFSETGYVLTRERPTVRAPDISIIRSERLAGSDPDHFFEGAPDLAVEVVSPSDPAGALKRKVQQYLRYGTHTVWVVYPQTFEVEVYEASGGRRAVTGDERLESPGLLPGFSVPVRELFQ